MEFISRICNVRSLYFITKTYYIYQTPTALCEFVCQLVKLLVHEIQKE